MMLSFQHLDYADEQMNKEGQSIGEVMRLLETKFGVSHEYAKQVVIEVLLTGFLYGLRKDKPPDEENHSTREM
jgi:hypothetical protein